MSLTSAIAIYFIIWWITLFAVLPWGVRSAHEAGENVEEGHEPGAPVNPMIGRKALITTAIASAIFAAVYWAVASGLIGG